MSELFIKTVKAKRIVPEEREYLNSVFSLLEESLKNGIIPDAAKLPSTASSLYVFALGSEKRRKEVLDGHLAALEAVVLGQPHGLTAT